MKFLKLSLFLFSLFFLTSCIGNMNPAGNSMPNLAYFITTKPLVIKKILLPKGTKLTYEESFLNEGGEQDQIMSEEKLIVIELPMGKTIDWGGVPVTSIDKFFNSKMCGFTVYAKFDQLSNDKKTKFSKLWQSSGNQLEVTVKNIDDWSFNKNNILDIPIIVDSTNVIPRKINIYNELQKVGSK